MKSTIKIQAFPSTFRNSVTSLPHDLSSLSTSFGTYNTLLCLLLCHCLCVDSSWSFFLHRHTFLHRQHHLTGLRSIVSCVSPSPRHHPRLSRTEPSEQRRNRRPAETAFVVWVATQAIFPVEHLHWSACTQPPPASRFRLGLPQRRINQTRSLTIHV